MKSSRTYCTKIFFIPIKIAVPSFHLFRWNHSPRWTDASEKGKSSFGFAYYLDTWKEERERGVTIQCKTKEFFTEKYHYTIVDAPGQKDYIKKMITGSATADVGLLLVPAEKDGFEAAIAKADAKAGVEEWQNR